MPRSGPPAYWARACRELTARDPILGRIITDHEGHLQSRGRAFETLARSIVGQQISTVAAQAIWDRLTAEIGWVTAPRIAALSASRLRACGLSQKKVEFLHDLARGFLSGELSARRWRRMDDEAIVAELVARPGIGRWTADMFLIFHLMRPDVLPIDDLGLRRGIARHYGHESPLARTALLDLGQRWRPWRTVATWYLWRSLDPVPVNY